MPQKVPERKHFNNASFNPERSPRSTGMSKLLSNAIHAAILFAVCDYALRSHWRMTSSVQSPRHPGETDADFRVRAEQAGVIARVLVKACLENRLIQELIEEGRRTKSDCIRNPTVRVEFEQAIAIGGIGETIAATKSKHWGNGPWIMPLDPDDQFFPDRITYVYRSSSLFYNRRFEQRNRLKELIGHHRPLVEYAKNKYISKAIFLRDLTEEQAAAIRRIFDVEPGEFWRACKGKAFVNLPKRLMQLRLFDEDEQ